MLLPPSISLFCPVMSLDAFEHGSCGAVFVNLGHASSNRVGFSMKAGSSLKYFVLHRPGKCATVFFADLRQAHRGRFEMLIPIKKTAAGPRAE
jgi:hypothetical protein